MDVNELIGIPYRKGGFTDNGCDCWGLILLAFRHVFQIKLELFEGATFCGEQLAEVIYSQMQCENEWKQIDSPDIGSVVVMYPRKTKRPEHIGVIVSPNRVLHSYKKQGSTQTAMRVINRMFFKVEFYKYEGVAA